MTKKLLILFFIWIILEGVFRKWLLNSYATPIFFIKYLIIAFSALLYFIKNNRISNKEYPFLSLILIYIVWCLFEIFNFRITSDYLVKALGLLVHFAFVPFIFLIPKYFNSNERIIKFFEILAYISIPIFILGVIQYESPLGSVINRYVKETEDIALVSGNPRITGVFSYITPYTSYLNLTIMIFLYLIVLKKTNTFNKIVLYSVFILGIINLFMTGSRFVVYLVIFKLILFILYLLTNASFRKLRILFGTIIIIFLSLIIINFTDIGSKSYLAFEERVFKTEDERERIINNYNLPYYMNYAGLVGYGLGTTYQGATSLISDFKDMPYVESENSRLIIELGIFGFFIIYILRLFIFFYSIKTYFRTKIYELKLLTVLLILYQLPTVLLYNNVTYNYIENIIYWFSVGLVVSINRISSNNKKLKINNFQNYKSTPEYI